MDTKALRQKVLDLAIRGKLVPQDPNDEPASVLLERIRQQKQQMVKKGKLKAKDIKNDTIIFVGEDNLHYEKFADGSVKCIEDEIPFDLPDGWAWSRVRDIASVKGGKRLPKGMSFSPCKTSHAYIRVTDMKNHSVNTDDLKYISEDVFLQIKNYTISKDDLYVTIAGTIGVTGEVPTELDGMNLTENAVKVTYIQINKTFLCLILQSEFVQQQFQDRTHQVAMPKLALERILSTLIPVCSMAAQSAIVNKFVEMDSLISQIGEAKEELAETVSKAKAKILDLAIRGQLVPQDPADEPASALLERIRAEKEELIKQGKIKHDKKESVIFRGEDNSYYEKMGNKIEKIDDEIPFDLPNGWAWCRFSEVIELFSGQDLTPDKYSDIPQGIPYITGASNLENGCVIVNRWTSSATTHATIGDLLLTVKGSGVGKMAICDIEDAHIARQIMALRCRNGIRQEYLRIVVSAFLTEITDQANGIIPGIRREVVLGTLFPLPPSFEQLKIFGKANCIIARVCPKFCVSTAKWCKIEPK